MTPVLQMYDAGVRGKLEPVEYCTTWLELDRLTSKKSIQINIRSQSMESNRNERAKSLLSGTENGVERIPRDLYIGPLCQIRCQLTSTHQRGGTRISGF